MSIEDEARKELERRKQKATQEEKRKQEIEQEQNELSNKNQDFLASFNLIPLFEELRNKYWGIGAINHRIGAYRYKNAHDSITEVWIGIDEKNIAWLTLRHEYEGLSMIYDENGNYDHEKIAHFHTEMSLGIRTDRNMAKVFANNSYLRKPKEQSFEIDDRHNIQKFFEKEISEYAIALTNGDLNKRNIVKEMVKRKQEEVEKYLKKREDRRKIYEESIAKESEPKGCWPFI